MQANIELDNDFNLDIICDEELSMFEEFDLDDTIIAKAKALNDEIFYKKVNKDAMDKIKNTLDTDEEIDFYFTGADIEVANIKAATSLMSRGSGITSTDWSLNRTLIFTNKKIYIMQRNNFLQYLSHQEVSYNDISKIHLYNKNKVMEIRYNKNKKKFIEFPEDSLDSISTLLDLKLNTKVKQIKGNYLSPVEIFSKLYLIISLLAAIAFIIMNLL
ncbi:MAG: hypothetical protein ACRDA5_07795 [Clostridium sp.]